MESDKADGQKRLTDEDGNPVDDNGNRVGVVVYGPTDTDTDTDNGSDNRDSERVANNTLFPSDSSSFGTPSGFTQDNENWEWRDQDPQWRNRDWQWTHLRIQEWLQNCPSDTSLSTPSPFSQDHDDWTIQN